MWIVEAGYCYGPKYLDKLQEKTQQHRLLQDLLLNEGFKVTCLSIVLGNSGAIHSTTESSLLQLGISRTAAQNLVLKLSDHAARYLHKLIKTRRQLEPRLARIYTCLLTPLEGAGRQTNSTCPSTRPEPLDGSGRL